MKNLVLTLWILLLLSSLSASEEIRGLGASGPGPVSILWWPPFSTSGASQNAKTPDPRRDMVTVLEATGPHPSLGEQAKVFDRFVGTWDADYSFHSDDGSVKHWAGEVVFGWIMDGRALQDIWISYPKAANEERTVGTTIRFFEANSRKWRIVWVAPPPYTAIIQAEGGEEEGRIVLRGEDANGRRIRWSFNDIRSDSFTWRGESSLDGGKTWKIEQEHHMRRRAAAPQ